MQRTLLTVAALAVTSAAAAQEPEAAQAARFGTSGVLSISSDFQAGVKGLLFSAPNGRQDPDGLFTFTLAPAVDYFAADHFSVGGQLLFAYARNGPTKLTAFGLGPRVGYEIPLGDRASFWPKLSLIYTSANVDAGAQTLSGSVTFDGWSLSVDVFAPFLFHVAQHFFVGFGPDLSTELVAKVSGSDATKTTSIGALFTVGGWF